jgi:hypothetical protein
MKVTEAPAGTLADRAHDLGKQHRAGIAPFGNADDVHAPVSLVTPEKKALYEACLERGGALEGLPSLPGPARGSR